MTSIKDGFIDSGPHHDYVDASNKKYSDIALLINPTNNTVTPTQQNDISKALANPSLTTSPGVYQLGSEPHPAMPGPIPNMELAKKCQSAPTTCAAFDDPFFANNCGMSMDQNGIGLDGKPFMGGMFVSSEDRSNQMDIAESSKTPYQVYQPTLGTSSPGTFALTKDQCIVVKEVLDCQSKQNFQVPNCNMCYTSQSFNRVDPDVSKIEFTLRLASEGELEVTSSNPKIKGMGKDLTITIPADAEGTTFIVKNLMQRASTSMYGYISGHTASNPFVLDVSHLVQTDMITNQKPVQRGKGVLDGKTCIKLVPGKKKVEFAFSCLIPFSFLSTEGGLGCDTGPVMTKESSASFLEADPCFNKANKPGNYTTECLQSRWISTGGTQDGEGYPTNQNRSTYLVDQNGSPLNLETITDQFQQKAIQALTGKKDKVPLSISEWDLVSRQMTGVAINTPCDVLDSDTISKECLSYLYNNQGAYSHIGATYDAPLNYVSRKGQNAQNTYCQPGAPLDPNTDTGLQIGLDYSQTGISGIKALYNKVHRVANDNSISSSHPYRKDTIKYCYGPNIADSPVDGVPLVQTVYGNNGSVSCDVYCGGPDENGSWNGELPKSWNGAKAVGGFFNGTNCKCQATGRGWGTKQRIYGNNGSVSCDTYCGGVGGGPWNGELPRSWNGARAVGGFITGSTDCICQPTGTGWR